MDYQQYPKRDLNEIRLLWHGEWYDGPMNGLLLLDGRKYWFETVAESAADYEGFYRHFVIIELTDEQLAEEERWHQLFREKVGTHSDYDETGRVNLGGVLPSETHAEFYDAYLPRQQPDYLQNRIVGWFED